LLGSFCEENFCGPVPERQQAAKDSVGLEVESGFVAVQGVEFGCGFEGQNSSLEPDRGNREDEWL